MGGRSEVMLPDEAMCDVRIGDGDMVAAHLPLRFPSLLAVEGSTVQVRAAKEFELLRREVQRCAQLIGGR